jgi:hypothetical protein
MKTISLKEAHQILSECSAVIIDDNAVVYPFTADLEDDDSNEFMYLSWDDDGLDFSVKFIEGNNKEVAVNGSTMVLYDNEGDVTKLTILVGKNLEE